jgi:transcription antitermination factor NusG
MPIRAWKKLSSAISRSAFSARHAVQVWPHPGAFRRSGGNAQRHSRTTERRLFPYVFVEMVMDDDTWHLVKHTSKVTGFVGGAKNASCTDL